MNQAEAVFLAATFLAATFFAATFLAAGLGAALATGAAFLAGARALERAMAAWLPSSSPSPSSPLAPALAAFAAAAAIYLADGSFFSNSKPILPSGCLTRNALKLRPVRDDLKPVSRSVRPPVSSLLICSRVISCCKMTLPERKSHVFGLATEFSQR